MSTLTLPEPPAHSQQWLVQVTLATTHTPRQLLLDKMADLADLHGVSVAARADAPGVVFTGETTQPGAMVDIAFAIAKEAVRYGMAMAVSLVDLRVCAPEIYEAEALRPDTPELMAATDVAEFLGVSRQRVYQLSTSHPNFPAPYAEPGNGAIWTRPTIEHFAKVWERKPGRPSGKVS